MENVERPQRVSDFDDMKPNSTSQTERLPTLMLLQLYILIRVELLLPTLNSVGPI